MGNQRTLHNALPIVAAAYGKKFGVKVEIGGDIAHTDGNTIVVPNIPDDYPHKDALWGYLAHEAAHVRFTDFTVKKRGKLHASVHNILEDSRIERAIMAEFPGVRHTLNETARYMLHAGHYGEVTTEDHPAAIMLTYSLYWLQTKLVGQTVLQESLDKARAALESVFFQDVIVKLDNLLKQAAFLKSTQDADALASSIIKMFKKEEKAQEKKQTQEQKEQQEQQKKQQEEDQNQSQDRRESQEGQGQNQVPDQDLSPEKQSAVELLHQLLHPKSKDLPDDAHTRLKNELNQIAQDKGNTDYLTVCNAVPTQDDTEFGRKLLNEVKSLTSKIRTQLYGLVQASQRVNTHHQYSGKRVNHRQLHRIATGDTRVFIKTKRKQFPNTAVHLLVDMSGSMCEGTGNGKAREDIAREAALALALALEGIPGVNAAVTFFGGYPPLPPVYRVIEHGERVQSQAGKFAFNADGGTPMAEALWYAAHKLYETREKRKVVIVITDGGPDNAPACRTVLNLYKQSGVEVFGIGIESSVVALLFDKHIVINDATCLQRALFKLMEQSLTSA